MVYAQTMIGSVLTEKGKTMYDELVKALRETDFSDGCPCVAEPLCKDKDCIIIQAADAIEDLQGRAKVLEKVADKWRETVPKWIPVTERLPEHEYGESTSVLTVDLYGVMRVTYFDGGNWCWQSGEALTTTRVAPITHWMPLPEPPKEVDDANNDKR